MWNLTTLLNVQCCTACYKFNFDHLLKIAPIGTFTPWGQYRNWLIIGTKIFYHLSRVPNIPRNRGCMNRVFVQKKIARKFSILSWHLRDSWCDCCCWDPAVLHSLLLASTIWFGKSASCELKSAKKQQKRKVVYIQRFITLWKYDLMVLESSHCSAQRTEVIQYWASWFPLVGGCAVPPFHSR